MIMISIDINKPQKLPGLISAFIHFDTYNEKLINKIRELDNRVYNKDDKTWEIPINNLEEFISCARNFEINITLQNDKQRKINLPKDFKFKTKPYSYQIDGVEYGLKNNSFILADEQGCVSGESVVRIKERGKSATRLIKIKYLKSQFEQDNTIQIKCLANNRFVFVPIKQVVEKGIKDTICINLEDTSLVCTSDHLIYTKEGWKEAGQLNIGDEVFTNGKQVCPLCGTSEYLITSKYSKFKGYCRKCMYKQRNGKHYKGDQIYKRLDKGGYVRLFGKHTRTMPNYLKMGGKGVYEHHQVWYEHTGHIVDSSIEVVHHINGIRTDNRFENLKLVTIEEHRKLHLDTSTHNLPQFSKDYIYKGTTKIQLVPKLQRITSITKSETQMVYDISINSDEIHNFICNNVVIHNCGKTKQLIDIVVARKLRKEIKQCLIIVGVNSIKYNWLDEIKIHSDESGWVLGTKFRKNGKRYEGGTVDKIEDLKTHKETFLITNVETLRNDEFIDVLKKQKSIGMIAVDEAHLMRNPQSHQGKNLIKLQDFKYKVAMTGTLLVNSPLDSYAILKWLGVEKSNYTTFKRYYCNFGGFGGYQITGYKHLDVLRESIQKYMLRRLKKDVLDLPDKLEKIEYVELTDNQWKLYNEIRNEILENVDLITVSNNPLSELLRLRQCTGWTGLLSSEIQESAKMERLIQLVDEIVDNGHKAIIYSNWTSMTDIIRQKLKHYNPAIITGQLNTVERQAQKDMFQTDDSCKVCIGTIGAMGTGLTLTAASYAIFYDLPWHKAAYDQCSDRIHRIGQNNNVTIIKLLGKDTIDERINEIVYTKGEMSDRLIDGKTGHITKNDILRLIV